jgi:hypothetical protein
MNVLKMSAQRLPLSATYCTIRGRKRSKNVCHSRVLSSPKAKVRGSNPLGAPSIEKVPVIPE